MTKEQYYELCTRVSGVTDTLTEAIDQACYLREYLEAIRLEFYEDTYGETKSSPEVTN